MQEDRYEVNKPMYILGFILMVIGACLIFLSVFLVPHFVWKINYAIPEYIIIWFYTLQQDWGWSSSMAAWSIVLVFLIPGLILMYIAKHIIMKLEVGLDRDIKTYVASYSEKKSADRSFFWLVLFLILGIIVIFWGISSSLSF